MYNESQTRGEVILTLTLEGYNSSLGSASLSLFRTTHLYSLQAPIRLCNDSNLCILAEWVGLTRLAARMCCRFTVGTFIREKIDAT